MNTENADLMETHLARDGSPGQAANENPKHAMCEGYIANTTGDVDA
jgi:hypothetical protein